MITRKDNILVRPFQHRKFIEHRKKVCLVQCLMNTHKHEISNLKKNFLSKKFLTCRNYQSWKNCFKYNCKPFFQVSRALPRIDDVSPPQRNHVYIKCKKLQHEAERHAQIERDNFILLKHLNKIMTDKRVDNFWLQENPK